MRHASRSGSARVDRDSALQDWQRDRIVASLLLQGAIVRSPERSWSRDRRNLRARRPSIRSARSTRGSIPVRLATLDRVTRHYATNQKRTAEVDESQAASDKSSVGRLESRPPSQSPQRASGDLRAAGDGACFAIRLVLESASRTSKGRLTQTLLPDDGRIASGRTFSPLDNLKNVRDDGNAPLL